jgi:uncharacterized surface protein with fasciclin (FAS1) repeats
MKIILIAIAFCAIITTAVAQNADTSTRSLKNERDELMNPDNTIAGNILAFKQANVFSQSLNLCGLIQTFNNPGPLTIFLPPDSAFTNLSKSKQDSLLKPGSKYDLIALITYHALPGKVSAKGIAKEINRQKGLAIFRTLSGASLKARFDEYRNIVLIDETGGKCIVQKSDLKQKNGLIHLVSSPLIPKFKPI